jgi:hypothetical protein
MTRNIFLKKKHNTNNLQENEPAQLNVFRSGMKNGEDGKLVKTVKPAFAP